MAERRGLRAVLVGATLLALLGSAQLGASAQPQRPAPVGSDPFRPGAVYRGDFPDPTVLRVGTRYYAAATTVSALNLPLLTSTNLRTWTARATSDPANPWGNDAMPTPPRWARTQQTPNGRVFMGTWAPSIVRTRAGYVAAYSVPRALDGRRCISLARSASPTGPYVDTSTWPLVCGPGVIDPQIFLDRGAAWLLFKLVGKPGRILVRRLTANATAFAPRSRNYGLLGARTWWEGGVVENPSMIRYRKRLYLFYSGNAWETSRYATGYAICRKVTGPCRRKGRVLASSRYLSGPGGAAAFTDTAGRLRLAFHAWAPGAAGYPAEESCLGTAKGCAQRRLHVASLAVGRRGLLRTAGWY